MTLTEEEKKICNHYSQRFEDGKVGCSRCPLAIDTRWYICKANCTEEEWEERRMIDSLHLYPEEKERLQSMEQQGFTVNTCNNWLCPFNNDGYCVSPEHGDECSMYGDEEFQKYLDDVYNESLSDGLRELTRQLMIMKWGRKE